MSDGDLVESMLDGDWPVFDRQCKCGRFMKLPKTVKFNVGTGNVVEAKGQCSRCGEVDAAVIGWRSDFK